MLKSAATNPGANGMTSMLMAAAMYTIQGARVKVARSAWSGTVSSLASTLKPWIVLWKRPRGPTRLGPSRSCMSAITLSSSWITTKAVGMVSSSSSVVASTKRPSPSSRLKSISRSSLLVDPAHDRVEAGHDGHGVGDQVAWHQQGHDLQADEARVAHPEPIRRGPAVADGVHAVQAAGALHRAVGPSRLGADDAGNLGLDRPMR